MYDRVDSLQVLYNNNIKLDFVIHWIGKLNSIRASVTASAHNALKILLVSYQCNI